MKAKKLKTNYTIIVAALATIMFSGLATAQEKLNPDTLECHIIGFSAGMATPLSGSTSSGMLGGNMRDLYSGSFLDFGIEVDYKYKNNWMVTLDGDMWFGFDSDNLKDRRQRMGDVYSPEGFILSDGGTDGAMMCYNRNLTARLGVAKIIPFLPKNPNSGLLLKLSGGWIMQKTVFSQDFNENPVPQLTGDYAKLYDHLRNGVILTESIGFCYMSNYLTYVNLKISFDISQCWMWSSRPYVIDNLMGLNGKDNNRYFDLVFGVKLTWLFPLMGKTTYDYYYF